jgi:hypothetical protein
MVREETNLRTESKTHIHYPLGEREDAGPRAIWGRVRDVAVEYRSYWKELHGSNWGLRMRAGEVGSKTSKRSFNERCYEY